MSKKKILFMLMFILSLPLLFEIGNEPATRVDAASKKQRNQKAHKVYEKKLNSIMTKYKEVDLYYKFADILGDNTDELIISYHPRDGYGSAIFLKIYTIKKNKIKNILSQTGYASKIMIFKNKNLICYTGSHENILYEYYSMKNGVYKKKAIKSKYDRKGEKWEYHNGKGKKITKTKFKKITNKFKGKKRTLDISKFKKWENQPTGNDDSNKTSNAETATYLLSAVSIENFESQNSVLKVSTSDTIEKNDKATNIKSLTLDVDSNCEWHYVNAGIRYPQNMGDETISYQDLVNYINNVKGLPENGYYSLKIYVENGKVKRVDFQCM